jgi:hypothetical protein
MAFFGGRWIVLSGVFAGVFSASLDARAEDQREEVVSLTFSPLHLLLPLVEVQAEYKLIDGLGLSLIGGYGWPTAAIEDENGVEEDVRFDVIEVGTQVMWYPLRKFRSLELGAEVMYLHVWTNEPVGTENATGLASGVALGPLVGYKFIVGPGFTGFVQGGVQFIAVHAEASDDTGASESDDASAVSLNLNLNLGWSF